MTIAPTISQYIYITKRRCETGRRPLAELPLTSEFFGKLSHCDVSILYDTAQ